MIHFHSNEQRTRVKKVKGKKFEILIQIRVSFKALDYMQQMSYNQESCNQGRKK